MTVLLVGCATPRPYVGVNPTNPQFERGRPCLPLDLFGAFISLPYQILFLDFKYGNHRVSEKTEQTVAEFLAYYDLQEVNVSINQWAPHKEMKRAYTNKQIGWPYKIFLPFSTLIASLLGRPFSGLLISDYYDPASNTIHIFSDDIAIALHEASHAKDFSERKYKGTYACIRMIPFVDLPQEYKASNYAFEYLQETGQYDELLRAYRVLIPAYMTYISGYISSAPLATVGAVTVGHIIGFTKSKMKEHSLIAEGKMPAKGEGRETIDEGNKAERAPTGAAIEIPPEIAQPTVTVA
jgi:hypothetical protein